MKLFLILAVISFFNNFILTYETYILIITKLNGHNLLNVLNLNQVFVYFKEIIRQIIYFIFFMWGNMKNKRFNFLLFLALLIVLGIIIGSTNTVGQRDYFEKSKQEFEENIDSPSYTNLPTLPEKDTSTRLAQKIDNAIYKGFEKILKKMFSSD